MTDLVDGSRPIAGAATDDPLRLERYRIHAEICEVLTDPKRLMLIDALRR